MTKLCCLLSPNVRCIGCNLPLCKTCEAGGICNNHNLPKCTATYYINWQYDFDNHAFNNIESLEGDRVLELKEKRRLGKANGKVTAG